LAIYTVARRQRRKRVRLGESSNEVNRRAAKNRSHIDFW
jgi:hypothetical protein